MLLPRGELLHVQVGHDIARAEVAAVPEARQVLKAITSRRIRFLRAENVWPVDLEIKIWAQ